MDPIAHFLLGALIAKTAGLRRRRSLWAAAFIAEAPDLDVFSWALPGPPEFWVHRSEATHSFPMALIWAFPMAWLLRRSESWRVGPAGDRRREMQDGGREKGAELNWNRAWVMALALLASHIASDWLTTFGTPLWGPFTGRIYALDLVGNLNLIPILLSILGLFWGVSHAAKAAWAGLAVFVAVSWGLREAAFKTAQAEYPHLQFSLFPHILNPLKFRAIGDAGNYYRFFLAEPLAGRMVEAGVFPKPEPAGLFDISRNAYSVKLFLKHNRWPIARLELDGDAMARVVWGNPLFSLDGRSLRGRAVVEIDSTGSIVRHWRDGKRW